MWILEVLLLVLCLLQYGTAADVEDLSGWMGEVQSILRSDGEQEVIKFDPTSVTQLSWKPRAFLAKQFLTEFECNHLIQLATDKLQASMVADVKSGKSVVSEIRTSLGMFVRRGHDEVVSRIEDRIAAWTLLPKENGECLQILRYQHGQKYEPHFDYFLDNKNKALAGGHRIATVLMYLSDVIKGGETVFPSADQDDDDDDDNTEGSLVKDDSWSECGKRGLGVKPKRGDALLFFNLHPSAKPDRSSLHAGCPVLEGEKWSATKWIHVEAFETGEEEEEHKHNKKKKNTDVECVNEDDNCEEWASYGECKNNPTYMLGTSEFPGACRKACKLC